MNSNRIDSFLTESDVATLKVAVGEAIAINFAHELDNPGELEKQPFRQNQKRYREVHNKLSVMESILRMAKDRGELEMNEDRLFASAVVNALFELFPPVLAQCSVDDRVRTKDEAMELVLIRGLPGSGKSTMARAMTTHEHYEADMFFECGCEYHYDASKIKDAHEWCQREVFKALSNGKSVVVSNTFTRRFEMEPYFEMAKTFGIEPNVLEATGNWPNVHGVPDEVVEKMLKRWEK